MNYIYNTICKINYGAQDLVLKYVYVSEIRYLYNDKYLSPGKGGLFAHL